jgi:hypothetical protein
MVPVVSLTCPEKAAIREPITPNTVVVHKLLRAFFNERSQLASLCIHGKKLI